MAEDKKIANAKGLLAQKRFYDAYRAFELLLPLDSHNCYIHWGLLLASHQCASESDLVVLGVPIGEDPHFQNAVRYADAATRTFYMQVAQLVIFSAHTRIYTTGCESGYIYLAQKWAVRYKKAVPADDPFLPLHDRMMEHLEQKSPKATYPGLLMHLYTSYDAVAKRIFQGEAEPRLERLLQTLIEHVRSLIRENYKKQLDQIYDQILAQYTSQRFRLASSRYMVDEQWANPIRAYCKVWGVNFNGADLDGYGEAPAKRWLSLIERLWNEQSVILTMLLSDWDRLFEFAQNAGSLTQANKQWQALLNNMSAQSTLTESQHAFLLKHRPNDPQLLWRYVNFATNNLRAMPQIDRSSIDNIKHYLNNPHKYFLSHGRNKTNALDNILLHLNKDKAALTTDLQQYVDVAIRNAPKEAADYTSQWKAYCARVDNAYASELAIIKQLQKQLERTIKQQKGSKNFLTVLMGVLKLIIGLLGVGVITQVALLGIKYAQNPTAALEYEVVWFYVVTILGSLIAGGLLLFIMHLVYLWAWEAVNKRDPYHDLTPRLCSPREQRISLIFGAFHYARLSGKRKKAKCILVEPLLLRILNRLTLWLIILATLAAAGAFAWSAFMLNETSDSKPTTAQVETVPQAEETETITTQTVQ